MWKCTLFLCAVTASLFARSAADEVREVKTSQGVVRGHKNPDSGVFAFYGIPYATAPISSHKFKAPLPGPAWLQPLDAVDKGVICPQVDSPYIKGKVKEENCLIASVYVPDTDDKKLPVAVYVHGGAFQLGYGDMVPPINLVKNKKLVAVTFNYRLGAHGFLCLGTENAPGNAGMKDQVALLRWVKKNIASFGGNPDDITIIGGSAGSVSVDLLMLSKTTRGLFNRVIPESGSAVGAIAMQLEPIQYAKEVASNLGFTELDDIYALESFFLDTPLEQFYNNANLFNHNSSFGLTPCVERDTGAEVFLDDAPINILRSGKYKKLPMLIGFTHMEGLMMAPNFDTWKEAMNEDFSKFLPVDLQFESDTEKKQVANLVKKFYFGNKPLDNESILGYIDFYSDTTFAYPALRAAQLYAEAGNDQVYLYEYSFVDENTPVVPYTDVRGATHCAQTLTVLDGIKYLNLTRDTNESDAYKNMVKVLQDIWYNFITTGKPVPEASSLPQWPAVGANRSPYMSLGIEVELRDTPIQKRAQFWDGIYSKYYKAPVPPPTPPLRPHSEL